MTTPQKTIQEQMQTLHPPLDGCRDDPPGDRLTVRDILRIAEHETGVTVAEILSPSRKARICVARQAVMLAAIRSGYSLNHIGNILKRDHTTVLHGARAAERREKAKMGCER